MDDIEVECDERLQESLDMKGTSTGTDVPKSRRTLDRCDEGLTVEGVDHEERLCWRGRYSTACRVKRLREYRLLWDAT